MEVMEVHETKTPGKNLNLSGGVGTDSHESWLLAGKLGPVAGLISSFEEGDRPRERIA